MDKRKKSDAVRKRLDWIMDRPHLDIRVTIGCRDCHDVQNLLASVALTAWLNCFHDGHDVWMKNPFRKGKS